MKLSMLEVVMRTLSARDAVLRGLEALKSDAFIISIDATRQDDAMLAVAKPVLERELKGRLASLDRDLDSYGVQVD